MCEYHELSGNTLLEPPPDEVLLRQVHPSQADDDGVPMRVAFEPSDQHGSLLSTKRERVTPEGAYREWVEAGRSSTGTWGVSLGEVTKAELHAVDDEATCGISAHAAINFRGESKGEKKRKSRILRDHAVNRTCLYRPVPQPADAGDS